jgi:hypothetical protein
VLSPQYNEHQHGALAKKAIFSYDALNKTTGSLPDAFKTSFPLFFYKAK